MADDVAAPTGRKLKIVPLTLSQANALVVQWHRHHKPALGHRFSLGLEYGGKLVGACIVGRPKAKSYDQYHIAEVTRLVTNGTKNACSSLYAAAARVAREMGFTSIQTYILDEEPGTSIRAAGWEYVKTTNGGQWDHKSLKQLRLDSDGLANRTDQPIGKKQMWRKVFIIT